MNPSTAGTTANANTKIETKVGVTATRSRWQDARFPFLAILLYVDAAAAINVLSVAMDSADAVFREAGDGISASPAPGNASAITPALSSSSSFSSLHREPTPPTSVLRPGRGVITSRETDEKSASRGGSDVFGRRLGKGGVKAMGWGGSAQSVVMAGARGAGGKEVGTRDSWGTEEEAVCPSRRTIVEVRDDLIPHNGA